MTAGPCVSLPKIESVIEKPSYHAPRRSEAEPHWCPEPGIRCRYVVSRSSISSAVLFQAKGFGFSFQVVIQPWKRTSATLGSSHRARRTIVLRYPKPRTSDTTVVDETTAAAPTDTDQTKAAPGTKRGGFHLPLDHQRPHISEPLARPHSRREVSVSAVRLDGDGGGSDLNRIRQQVVSGWAVVTGDALQKPSRGAAAHQVARNGDGAQLQGPRAKKLMSSNPLSAMSCGTRLPISVQTSRTPRAITSFPHTTASTSGYSANSVPPAAPRMPAQFSPHIGFVDRGQSRLAQGVLVSAHTARGRTRDFGATDDRDCAARWPRHAMPARTPRGSRRCPPSRSALPRPGGRPGPRECLHGGGCPASVCRRQPDR